MIVGDVERPKHVLDCSLGASDEGVLQGMAIREALALCPDAVVVGPDPGLYRRLWETTLTALDEIR